MVASAAMALAACAGGDTSGEAPAESQAARFGDAALAGLCENANAAVDADEPGAATQEEAVDLFVQQNGVLSDTTIEGTQIVYEGEEVGSLVISQAPAGGYYVETAEWCYPAP